MIFFRTKEKGRKKNGGRIFSNFLWTRQREISMSTKGRGARAIETKRLVENSMAVFRGRRRVEERRVNDRFVFHNGSKPREQWRTRATGILDGFECSLSDRLDSNRSVFTIAALIIFVSARETIPSPRVGEEGRVETKPLPHDFFFLFFPSPLCPNQWSFSFKIATRRKEFDSIYF